MKRELFTVFGTHMFIEIFFLIHLALIPTFIKEFNLNLFQASLIATIPSLVVLLSYIPAGLLVDKVGAKPLLLISMILEGVAALFISQIRDYLLLILAVSLIRISSPVYHTSGLSVISKVTDSKSTGKMMGFHNALGSLGATIGLLSLSILGGILGWRFIYLLWSIPVLMWCIPILKSEVGKYEEQEREHAKGSILADFRSILNFRFTLLLLIIAFRSFGISVISTFITTYMVEFREFSQEAASMVFGLGPLIGILSSLASGYLSGRFGDAKTLLWMVVGSIFSLALLAWAESLDFMMLTYILYSFFNSGSWSPIGALVAALTPGSKRGTGYSSYFFVGGAVSTIQPPIPAVIIGYTNLHVIFPIGISLLSICAVLLGFFYHGSRTFHGR